MNKIFISRGPECDAKEFGLILKFLRDQPNTKIYLIGELGYDWELVDQHKLDGLVKAPAALRPIIEKKE